VTLGVVGVPIAGREKFIIATKFGALPAAGGARALDSSPERIRSQLADSLSRLGTTYIDLYYQHRVDPATPIEETMACLKELVAEGKIRYVGLSECTPEELRRAHAVHPVSAIQMVRRCCASGAAAVAAAVTAGCHRRISNAFAALVDSRGASRVPHIRRAVV
jgi:aryl-alcohol dehydrogenase-like predicted oxidoreductase